MDQHDLQTGFTIGPWQVWPMRGELQRGDEVRHLEPKVMDVLVLLARYSGEVVERDALVKEVWDGRVVSDDPLSKCVAELRKVLGDSARQPRFIRTVHKRGYALLVPVAPITALPAAPATGQQSSGSALRRAPKFTVAAILVAAAFAAWWMLYGKEDTKPVANFDNSVPMLAVLPFAGNDPDDSYLVDGIRNELLTRLASNDAWQVVARSSVDNYLQVDDRSQGIAIALGATALIEGDVQREGNLIRINARLIDVASNEHLWAETFERDLTAANLFNIQRQIVDRIATELQTKLSKNPDTAVAQMPTTNLAAYSAYLRGRRSAAAESVESLNAAIENFQQAIRLDPDFALAYAAAADAYMTLGAYFLGGMSVDESIEMARPMVERAHALDPDIAEAHAASGLMYMIELDPESAELAFRRAIEIQPSYARIYQLLSHLRWNQGRHEEAIDYAQQALELDRWSGAINLDLARYYDQSGRFQEAMTEYVRVVNIEPDNAFAPLFIAALKYLTMGNVVDAVVWYHEAASKDPQSPSVQAVPATAYLELGDLESAAEFVARGLALDPNNFWPVACNLFLSMRRGNRDAVVENARALHTQYEQSWDALRALMKNDVLNGTPDIALARYAQAHPELTEPEVPQVNPQNVVQSVDLAYLLRELGEHNRANDIIDAALSTMETMQRLGTSGYWVNDVRAYAVRGQNDKALAALRSAIDDGWRVLTWYHLYLDLTLMDLHENPAFIAMRDEVEQDLAVQAAKLQQLKASGELKKLPAGLSIADEEGKILRSGNNQ